MKSRRQARQDAVEIVFEAAQRGITALAAGQQRIQNTGAALDQYTQQILTGVTETVDVLDEAIASHSRGWTLERIPNVDLAILRVACWEVIFQDELDDPVAISEAMKIAEEYSTDNSPSYINAILDRISGLKELYRS